MLSPGHRIAFAVEVIDRAETQILVNAYTLTKGSGIVDALVRAKQRNVNVELIADKTAPCERGSGIEPLARAGVPVWIDRGVSIAHNKAMVIDRKVVLTGSMNFTASAAQNSENVALISSEANRHRLCDPLARSPRRLGALHPARGMVSPPRDG